MFVAEELDADWSHVTVVAAPADEARFGNPMFWGLQITAGSRTCLGYFDVLRLAGAQARYVLLTAAARLWNCPISELQTAESFVLHQPSARRAPYSELIRAAHVPEKFPDFVAPADRPQLPDDFFGDPAPSPIAPRPGLKNAIRLKSPNQYRLLCRDKPRIDIPPKVNGNAVYGIDIRIPEMAHAMIETGSVPSDIPDTIDDAAVRRIPGVLEVVRLPYGVAVVGSDFFAARAGRQKLRVTWRPGTKAHTYNSAQTLDEFSRIAGDPTGNPGIRVFQHGDPVRGRALLSRQEYGVAGTEVVSFEARSELVYHAPLEPQNAILLFNKNAQSAEAWVGTQWPKMEQEAVARVLGIKAADVKINSALVGGSFGRRQEPGAIIDAAHIVRVIPRPIKVTWTREDDLKRNPFRQALVCRIDAAVDASGVIKAIRHRVVADSWFARLFPDFFAQYKQSDPGNWVGALNSYDIPIQTIEAITVRKTVDVCYMRGIGVAQVKFSQESLIDQISSRHGQDPLQYRLRMLRKVPRATRVLKAVSQMADWSRRRDGRALGLACIPYSNSYSALIAEVSLDRGTGQIHVHHVWSCIDAGLALQPDIISAQLEGGIIQGLSIALMERATLKDGVVQESNFHEYPVLRMSHAPKIDIQVLSTDNAPTGIGEIGVIQIAPAVNNAVAILLGTHLKSLPMLPEQVLRVLKDQQRL